MVEAVSNALKNAGATVDDSCGMHVHVDARDIKNSGAQLANVVKLAAKYEALYLNGLNVSDARKSNQYCPPLTVKRPTAATELSVKMTATAVKLAWYQTTSEETAAYRANDHYNSHYAAYSRYCGVNLHAVWNKGTVEFRYFAGTLDFATIEECVALMVGLVVMATRYSEVPKGVVNPTDKKAWKWLVKWTGVPKGPAKRLVSRFPENVAAAA